MKLRVPQSRREDNGTRSPNRQGNTIKAHGTKHGAWSMQLEACNTEHEDNSQTRKKRLKQSYLIGSPNQPRLGPWLTHESTTCNTSLVGHWEKPWRPKSRSDWCLPCDLWFNSCLTHALAPQRQAYGCSAASNHNAMQAALKQQMHSLLCNCPTPPAHPAATDRPIVIPYCMHAGRAQADFAVCKCQPRVVRTWVCQNNWCEGQIKFYSIVIPSDYNRTNLRCSFP